MDKLNGYCIESISEGLSQLKYALDESGIDTEELTTYGLLMLAVASINKNGMPSLPIIDDPDIAIYHEYVASEPPLTQEQKIEIWKNDMGAYYKSRWWHNQRMQALSKSDYQCDICGSTYDLQVHHLTYETVGRERPEDLRVLCFYCHRKAHRKVQE